MSKHRRNARMRSVMRSKSPRKTVGALAACLAALLTAPAEAADSETIITQAKALTGNVTPGDRPGFPVTISAPGSYKLGSNLLVPAGKNGIVTTSLVTIDLNGFMLTGHLGAANGIVEAGLNQSAVTIRNGTIQSFKGDGIRGAGSYWTVQNMRITFNGGNGVAAGHLLHLRDSVVYINKLNGVTAINWASILDSTIVASGLNGVVCENHCLVEGNMISQNGSSPTGGVGVSASLGTVLGNTITVNQGFGISGSATGYGNNTLVSNNGTGGGKQVSDGLIPLQPNACSPAC
jgi:hypothetical protein